MNDARSTRCSFPAVKSVYQTAPRSGSAANCVPPGRSERPGRRAGGPLDLGERRALGDQDRVGVVPGAMSVIVDPVSQTPEAASSPDLALPTPRNG